MKKLSGFTLVELLISTALLSLLMLGGIFSYGVFSARWNDEFKQYGDAKNLFIGTYQLNELISSIKPYIIKKGNGVGFLFVGQSDRLLAVRNNSFFNPKVSEVMRLSFVKNSKNLFDLVYQSAPFSDDVVLDESEQIQFKTKYIILQDIENYEISYFGFDSRQRKNFVAELGTSPKWFSSFSGLDKELLPEVVHFRLTIQQKSADFYFSFDENADRHISDYLSSGV
ncbi:PulJ/GspJ family protein [Pseudoalteromonas xiamenensis]